MAQKTVMVKTQQDVWIADPGIVKAKFRRRNYIDRGYRFCRDCDRAIMWERLERVDAISFRAVDSWTCPEGARLYMGFWHCVPCYQKRAAEQERRQRIRAAAFDLYDAAKFARDELAAQEHGLFEGVRMAVERLDAALLKAEGREDEHPSGGMTAEQLAQRRAPLEMTDYIGRECELCRKPVAAGEVIVLSGREWNQLNPVHQRCIVEQEVERRR